MYALKEVEEESRKAGARETTTKVDEATLRGKLVEYLWYLKKEGYAPSTIETRRRVLKRMLKRGVNILDPEAVKEYFAKQEWKDSTRNIAIETYTSFLRTFDRSWKPPITRKTRQLPFIPTEREIDQLIASCGKKTATFLQLLKETAMRAGEAWRLRWVDVDFEKNTIRITPEKGSEPRIFKISRKLASMLNALPRRDERVFGNASLASIRTTFCKSRLRAAQKLKNPRLQRIHFHTFRHWKATMLYHQTKDILYVMRFLGHKSIRNTLLYVQLEETLFREESEEFICKVAKTVKEAKALVEAGFDYVCEFDDVKIFRKRK